MQEKTIRCTLCRAEFSEEELTGYNCCPTCTTTSLPQFIKHDTAIVVNWHDLRILCIWAQNWQDMMAEKNPKQEHVVEAIVKTPGKIPA